MSNFVVEVSIDMKEALGHGKFQARTLIKKMEFHTIPDAGDYIALTPLGPLNWAKVEFVVHNPIMDDITAAAMIWCTLEHSKIPGAANDIEATVLVNELGWQYC